jgi:hypothetical protein
LLFLLLFHGLEILLAQFRAISRQFQAVVQIFYLLRIHFLDDLNFFPNHWNGLTWLQSLSLNYSRTTTWSKSSTDRTMHSLGHPGLPNRAMDSFSNSHLSHWAMLNFGDSDLSRALLNSFQFSGADHTLWQSSSSHYLGSILSRRCHYCAPIQWQNIGVIRWNSVCCAIASSPHQYSRRLSSSHIWDSSDFLTFRSLQDFSSCDPIFPDADSLTHRIGCRQWTRNYSIDDSSHWSRLYYVTRCLDCVTVSSGVQF